MVGLLRRVGKTLVSAYSSLLSAMLALSALFHESLDTQISRISANSFKFLHLWLDFACPEFGSVGSDLNSVVFFGPMILPQHSHQALVEECDVVRSPSFLQRKGYTRISKA